MARETLAGQAVVFLASHAERVTMVVRGPGLESSMSKYLIDRIEELDNVDVLLKSEVVSVQGDASGALDSATIRYRTTNEQVNVPARYVFVFIGAEPNTDWLNGCVELDDKGYILTGARVDSSSDGRSAFGLQTSIPGVFAIGDVRSGSTKGVASAVGEGAAVVSQIHSMLSGVTTPA